MKKSLSWVAFSGILGIVFLLIMVGILNIIAPNVASTDFQAIVSFLNENLALMIVISIILLFANAFEVFVFPFNLVYPIFNAIGSIVWIVFAYRLLYLIDSLVEPDFYFWFWPFKALAFVIVPIIVLIVGYLHIIVSLIPGKKELEEDKPVKKKPKKKSEIEWDDVGEEFKMAFYNLGQTLKNEFKPKK